MLRYKIMLGTESKERTVFPKGLSEGSPFRTLKASDLNEVKNGSEGLQMKEYSRQRKQVKVSMAEASLARLRNSRQTT